MEKNYWLQRTSAPLFSSTRKLLFYFYALFFLSFLSPSTLFADTELNVTMQVYDTTFVITGKTSPDSKVTILEDGAVIGTTLADSSGDFSKTFPAQDTGLHNYSVYSTDADDLDTSTINYSVSLFSHTVTTLSNVILPPTFSLASTEIAANEELLVEGSAVPGSQIVLYVSKVGSSSISSHTFTIGSAGLWEYSLDLDSLGVGTYEIYGQATTAAGYQSEASNTLTFEVTAAPTATPTPIPTATNTLTPTPTPTTGVEATVTPTEEPGTGTPTELPTATATATFTPTPLPPTATPTPRLPRFVAVFDENKDDKIETKEVFTVMKKWVDDWKKDLDVVLRGVEEVEGEKVGKPSERGLVCDLNDDGKCNLRDFSILLYYVDRE